MYIWVNQLNSQQVCKKYFVSCVRSSFCKHAILSTLKPLYPLSPISSCHLIALNCQNIIETTQGREITTQLNVILIIIADFIIIIFIIVNATIIIIITILSRNGQNAKSWQNAPIVIHNCHHCCQHPLLIAQLIIIIVIIIIAITVIIIIIAVIIATFIVLF